MVCPRCRAKFRAGFTQCPDCDVELLIGLSTDPMRDLIGTTGDRWCRTLAGISTAILLGWLYNSVGHVWFIPNVFAGLVGLAVGVSIRPWQLLRTPRRRLASLMLILLSTLAAISMPYLLLYIGSGEVQMGFFSFLGTAVANMSFEVWSEETNSIDVFRGFEAFLFSTLSLWAIASMMAIITADPPLDTAEAGQQGDHDGTNN